MTMLTLVSSTSVPTFYHQAASFYQLEAMFLVIVFNSAHYSREKILSISSLKLTKAKNVNRFVISILNGRFNIIKLFSFA